MVRSQIYKVKSALHLFGRTAAVLSIVTFLAPAARAADNNEAAVEAAKALATSVMSSEIEWNGPTESPVPVPGKRVAVISCCQAAEGSARPVRAMVEAGEILGWTVDVFDGKGDPQEQNKAVNAAVDAKYDSIALIFVDTPVVAEGVNRAIAAKIPLITYGDIKNTPETIPDVSHDWAESGRAIAAYMIWKANGDVNALLLKNTDMYMIEHGQFLGTDELLSDPSNCPNCKTTVKGWALANLDTQPASIASAALQADPTINYVWCFDACLSRVVRNLVAMGVGADVKAVGFDCNGENVQLIKDGIMQVACVADPREWAGYAVVDNLNRLMQGQPAVQQNIPIRMFDTDNITELTDDEVINGWKGDFDFASQYRKIWGK